MAEMVCIRRAERENKGSLGYKFWNTGDLYQIQVRVAHKLIKKYGEKAILHYLNSPSGKNVYSLGFLHKSKKKDNRCRAKEAQKGCRETRGQIQTSQVSTK
jgi:hypothetical protein